MGSLTSTRRFFLGAIGAGAALLPALPLHAQPDGRTGRLSTRPKPAAQETPPGTHALGLRTKDDALLYIPEAAGKFDQAPLVVSLHSAYRDSARGIDFFRSQADRDGFLVLAPRSAGATWDLVEGAYGRDVAFIDRCLARAFEMRTVDPHRIAMAGFSDGASYALSLGLRNGDLFTAVLGFSAGFLRDEERYGKPPVFLAHGTLDPYFPVEVCGRRIEQQLEREGYRVTYREQAYEHDLPPEVAAEGMNWFMELPG